MALTESASRGASVLRLPAFRFLWSADAAGRLGHYISTFALPLLAVTVLAATGTQVGAVSAMQFLPVLALSLSVGAWTARTSLRRLLILANLVRALTMFTIGALAAAGWMTFAVLLAGALIIGSAAVVHDIGLQVAVPRLLAGDLLLRGNGLLQATTSITQMGGPAVAGFLVQSLAAPLATVLTGCLLSVAAATMVALPDGPLRPAAGPGRRPTIGEGIAFVRRCRPVRDLCVQSALFNLHEQALVTVFLLFGVRVLDLDGSWVGVIIGLGSVGAFVGSLLAGRAGSRFHLGFALTSSIFLAAVGLLLVPVLAATGVPRGLLAVGFVVNGAALAVYNVVAITLRQELPPSELLGSVTASYRIAAFGSMPVGAFLGGLLTDLAGSGTALWVVSVSLMLCSLLLFASPVRRCGSVSEARVMSGWAQAGTGADG